MSRTITALFDTRADADAGAARLREAGVAAGHVAVHDQTTAAEDYSTETTDNYSTETTGDRSTAHDRGLWASIKGAFLPHEDRHTYEEGIRRGGFLLTAHVDDDKTPEAVAALENANTVDLDDRAQQWRSDGWDYAAPLDATNRDDATVYSARDTAIGGSRFRSYVNDRD